jgi:hypothetical protein
VVLNLDNLLAAGELRAEPNSQICVHLFIGG